MSTQPSFIISDALLKCWQRSKEAHERFRTADYKSGKYQLTKYQYQKVANLMHLIQWELEFSIRRSVEELNKHALPHTVGPKIAKFVKSDFVGESKNKGKFWTIK